MSKRMLSRNVQVSVLFRGPLEIATIGVEDARTLKLKHIFYKITTLSRLFVPIFTWPPLCVVEMRVYCV